MALPLVYAGMSSRQRRARAQEMLELVGLGDRMKNKPNQLSGGQRQRVAIARALANQPSLVLADEPTGNLDSTTAKEIMEMLTKVNAKGNTIVVVTHEREIAEYAQRIIHLKDGRIERHEVLTKKHEVVMKIYTKTGDKGETGLFGGSRVSKADLRVEAYGTVDELNSVLAVVIEHVGHNNPSAKRLINVQDYLFRIGSHLASLDNPTSEFLPEAKSNREIERLEKDIDDLTNDLPPLKNFILPGGSLSNAYCHVARSVCRRENAVLLPLILPLIQWPLLYNTSIDYLIIFCSKSSTR